MDKKRLAMKRAVDHYNGLKEALWDLETVENCDDMESLLNDLEGFCNKFMDMFGERKQKSATDNR